MHLHIYDSEDNIWILQGNQMEFLFIRKLNTINLRQHKMNLKLCPSLKAREHLIRYFQKLSGSINLSWKKKISSEQMFSNKFKIFHEVCFIADMFHDFKESYF